MTIEKTVRSLRSRAPWSVGKQILAENEIPRSRGWDNTVAKVTDESAAFADKLEPLEVALKQHLLCGEKASGLYTVDGSKMAALRKALRTFEVPDTEFSQIYPYVLPEEALPRVLPKMTPVAVEEDGDGIAAVLSSVRTIPVREAIPVKELPDQAASVLAGYEQIYGLKTIRMQAFDVIWVPHDDNSVEVRVDSPEGSPVEMAAAAHSRAVAAFHELLSEEVLVDPVNLFPIIDRIYSDASEGRVVELGFGTTTASIKHERMRRHFMDLREEEYHRGGKAALTTPIEPYRISVVWKRDIGSGMASYPELSVNSTSRAAGSANPRVESVFVRKCMGSEDYEFVRSRILHHLRAH